MYEFPCVLMLLFLLGLRVELLSHMHMVTLGSISFFLRQNFALVAQPGAQQHNLGSLQPTPSGFK